MQLEKGSSSRTEVLGTSTFREGKASKETRMCPVRKGEERVLPWKRREKNVSRKRELSTGSNC